jgi:hypothetical protein
MSLSAYTAKTWVDYADTPCLEALELNRIDSGISAVTAELIGLIAALPTTYQAKSAELTAIAGISSTGYAKRTGAGVWTAAAIPSSDLPSIALTGEATGSGASGSIAVTLTTASVTGKALTGLPAVSNSAIAATDSILAAMAKLQGQINDKPSISFSRTAKTFFAAPNAANGAASFRTIVASDLPTSGVTAGTYGSASVVPVPTVDAYGRVTGMATATITPAAIGAQVAGSYAPAAHSHVIADVTGLQGALDGKYGVSAGTIHAPGSFVQIYPTLAVGDGQYGFSANGGVGHIYSASGRIDIRARSGGADATYVGQVATREWANGAFALASHTHAYEPTIAGSAATNYWCGDKVWRAFPTTWAWANLTGVPSTFTPSAHTHNEITLSRIAIDTYSAEDTLTWENRNGRGNHFGRIHGVQSAPSYFNYVHLRESTGTVWGAFGYSADGKWYVVKGASGAGPGTYESIWTSGNLTGNQTAHTHNKLVADYNSWATIDLGGISVFEAYSSAVKSYQPFTVKTGGPLGPTQFWVDATSTYAERLDIGSKLRFMSTSIRVSVSNGSVLPTLEIGQLMIIEGPAAGGTHYPVTSSSQACRHRNTSGVAVNAVAGGTPISLDMYGRSVFLYGRSSTEVCIIG